MYFGIVDRVAEIVARGSAREIEMQDQVNAKCLRLRALLGVCAVPPLHDDIVKSYPVHPLGLQSRTIASETLITSRFCATSCTRTMSIPAAMPSAVVAAVP